MIKTKQLAKQSSKNLGGDSVESLLISKFMLLYLIFFYYLEHFCKHHHCLRMPLQFDHAFFLLLLFFVLGLV